MKKMILCGLVLMMVAGCASPKPVSSPTPSSEPTVVLTPDPNPKDRPYPTINGEVKSSYDYNVMKSENQEEMKITFYDRATDIIGHTITFFDSSDKMLAQSSGFSTTNEYIEINDDIAWEKFFQSEEVSEHSGLDVPTLDVESGNYIKITCSVFLKDKVEQQCSEVYILPNELGYEYKLFMIKDSNGNYRLSPTEN